MKTLEQIKNDYAVSKGYNDWLDMAYSLGNTKTNTKKLIIHENEVMKIYAMECLKLASYKIDNSSFRSTADYIFTVKEVTNENNIIK